MENHFLDWIQQIYLPSLLVYSTESATKIIAKNKLTPAEFIRPFCDFSGKTVSFNFAEKFSINLKNFKLDTFDANRFAKKNANELKEILEQVLLQNQPEFNTSYGSNQKISLIYQPKNRLNFISNLENKYNFKWYTEYEKTFLESQFFNELEMYQQPFGFVFICSINDKPTDIKNNVIRPILLKENVLDSTMCSMILVLYDKSEEELQRDKILVKFDAFKKEYSKFYIYFSEINNFKEDDTKQKDIWSPLIHKLDYYSPFNEYILEDKGFLISLEERSQLKESFYKFLNDSIRPYLQKRVNELDDEITQSKKGFKNQFKSLFKGSDKIEYIQTLGIYKLTDIEKKIYLLSTIQFYFRDYENAAENLRLLYNDLKVIF